MRASAAVNRQSTGFRATFRSRSHAPISLTTVGLSGPLRSGHSRLDTFDSSPDVAGQLLFSGVFMGSSRSIKRRDLIGVNAMWSYSLACGFKLPITSVIRSTSGCSSSTNVRICPAGSRPSVPRIRKITRDDGRHDAHVAEWTERQGAQRPVCAGYASFLPSRESVAPLVRFGK